MASKKKAAHAAKPKPDTAPVAAPKGELTERDGRYFDEEGREFLNVDGEYVAVVVVDKPEEAPREAAVPASNLGDLTPPMEKSTLLYNPGPACAAPAYGQEIDLAEGITDVRDLAVADLLVGEGDSRGGSMSKKGIVRVYGKEHPRAAETKALTAFADDLYGRFISKNETDRGKRRSGRTR